MGNKKKKEKANSCRVITQEWLDENGFSPLEDVIKRIEGSQVRRYLEKNSSADT